ncbi:hypothetical protein ACWF7H_29235 [Peribacillus butanolivorans]|uniref:hypothetical protein n=1 Tax=Peribacillus butanolivorans TaxID=421767 RepID=UPI00368302FB
MAGKSESVNYGLKVEQRLKYIPNLGEEVIQYYITENDIPLYEVNRWVEYVSVNSYKTGGNYAAKSTRRLKQKVRTWQSGHLAKNNGLFFTVQWRTNSG